MKHITVLFVALCFIFISQSIEAQTSNFLDPNFAPVLESSVSSVNVIAKQSNGKILVGGNFRVINDKLRPGLARLNADGSLDDSFNPPIVMRSGGIVRAIVVQPDGKILVGGSFDAPNFLTRNITRLNVDGSIDALFNATTDSTVNSIALQGDKIFIGGAFNSVNLANRRGIARLNMNGSTDTTFTLMGTQVNAIVVQPDGSIIIGAALDSPGSNYGYLAKVNGDGTLDQTFNANARPNSSVIAVRRQTDGKILIGGAFNFVGPVERIRIARLNADGTLDNSFNPDIYNTDLAFPRIESIDLDTAGSIFIGGIFTSVNGTPRFNVAKLNANGTLDTSFAPAISAVANAVIFTVLAENGGSILTGGRFLNFNGSAENRIVRLNANGTQVPSFNAKVNMTGRVYDIEIQPDGKIIAAGTFIFANNRRYSTIARFLPDGTIDASFTGSGQNQFTASTIEDIEILSDGKVVIVGAIGVSSNPTGAFSVVRLNADGTLDTTFAPVIYNDTYPKVVKSLPNGQILVGGNFNQLNGVARSKIARINSDGTLDDSFNPTFAPQTTASVNDISLRNDGKILVGGSFQTVNGVSRNNLALLNQDGTLETAFATDVSATVNSIKQLSNGTLLISGSFASVNGTPRNNVAKLLMNGQIDTSFNADASFAFPNTQIKTLPDGKIILTKQNDVFSIVPVNTIPNNLVVLNSNGSIYSFLPNTLGFNDGISDVEVRSDGKILVGGIFSKVGDSVRYSLALLNSINFPAKTLFDFDGDGNADVAVFRPSNGVWYLNQSQNGFTGISFGQNGDRIVPADYDGDGKTDLAVFRAGVWYIQRSQAGFTGISFGEANDIPVPADYDGDGKADIAVFRPNTGIWYLLRSSVGFTGTAFGQTGDKPVAADYDGDGKTDVAIYRSGTWYIQRSQLGFTGIAFGESTDKPVPADYDGDGKTDIAVFRPSNGTWYLQRSTAGFTGMQFGFATDSPVPADYDGDGRADVAVYRAGAWYLQRSTAGFVGISFGANDDLAVPNAFVR